MTLILAVYIVSLALVLSEAFLPGLVVGVLGLSGLGWSIWQAWTTRGWPTGLGLLVIAVILIPAAVLKAIRRIQLHARIDGTGATLSNLLPGMEGTAATPLRPAGAAIFNGNRTDVLTRGEPLDRGAAIRIVAIEGNHVVVAHAERRES